MKKSSKIIILSALSFILVEEPDLCESLLHCMLDIMETKAQKDAKKHDKKTEGAQEL